MEDLFQVRDKEGDCAYIFSVRGFVTNSNRLILDLSFSGIHFPSDNKRIRLPDISAVVKINPNEAAPFNFYIDSISAPHALYFAECGGIAVIQAAYKCLKEIEPVDGEISAKTLFDALKNESLLVTEYVQGCALECLKNIVL